MKYYIAGPMTGLPGFNFQAFDAVEARLRAAGVDAVNPAALDRRDYPGHDFSNNELPVDFDYNERLRIDLAEIQECTGVVLLPGWNYSKGAKIELAECLRLGLEIVIEAHNV